MSQFLLFSIPLALFAIGLVLYFHWKTGQNIEVQRAALITIEEEKAGIQEAALTVADATESAVVDVVSAVRDLAVIKDSPVLWKVHRS